jgi:hypothetical protein
MATATDDVNSNMHEKVVASFTTAVFTMECVLKIVAEGKRPDRYFTDPQNGAFNCFDLCVSFLFSIFWAINHSPKWHSLINTRL